MKKGILVLMIGFLLIGVNLYAAGDLIVEGNVGIGTTNPGGGAAVVKLDVRGNITATQDTDTSSAIYLSRSGGPTSGWNSPGGTWGVYRYGTGEGDRFSIGIAGVNEPFRIHTDGNVIMGVTSSGASSGNVGIGTTAPVYKLDVAGIINASGGYTQVSDVKFKKDITAIESPLSKILNIRGVSYSWKTEEYRDKGFEGSKHYGVIGQEVEKVLPDVVKETPNGEKIVAYTELIPVLIEAMKEQQKIIEELKTEVQRLKAKDFISKVQ